MAATQASPIANGPAAVRGPDPRASSGVASTSATKLPPTAPAKAGVRAGANAAARRRPPASRVAWTTCAAKAPTSRSPATTYR